MERSTATVNRRSPTIRRILREAAEIQKSPSKDFTARPLEQDIFVWHFTLRGPPAPSPFADGFYHGRILLSANYPLRPPMFRFLTPSGRFEVNRDICLSMSGFHEETWQPAWGIRTALVALRAFMDTDSEGQVGGMDSDDKMRKRLAQESRGWRCPECGGGGEEEDMVNAQGDDSETQIPEELKLGYKDQLKGKKQDEGNESTGGSGSGVGGEDQTSALGINAADGSANVQPVVQPATLTAAQTQRLDQSASEQQQMPPPFLQPNPMLFPSSNYPFQQQHQQDPQEPRDLDALQQEYALLMQQYQTALYSAQLGGQYMSSPPPPPPHDVPVHTEDAPQGTEQQEVPQQQPAAAAAAVPTPLAPVAAAPPPPPIHTFLHPNQDRGTAMIDVAIGCILGFIALLYFNKMAMTIAI